VAGAALVFSAGDLSHGHALLTRNWADLLFMSASDMYPAGQAAPVNRHGHNLYKKVNKSLNEPSGS